MVDDPPGAHRLIESIYEAACDVTLWPEILDGLVEKTGSLFATYSVWDRQSGQRTGLSQSSSSYWSPKEYEDHYARIDPRLNFAHGTPPGYIYRCHEHLDDGYVAQSRFFQDYALKHDRRFLMAAHLISTDQISSFVVLQRSPKQGRFEENQSRLLESLAPHFRRAAQVHLRFKQIETAHQNRRDALDHLSLGIISADRDGCVSLLNRAAEEIIQANDGLSVRYSRLMASGEPEAAALANAVRVATGSGTREQARQGTSIIVARPSGREAYRVSVTPLYEREGSPLGQSTTAKALVLVNDPEVGTKFSKRQVASLYGLTHSEAVVALLLARGKHLEEIALERNVSLGTVRVHVKHVLHKTGTDRQADLIRALLSIPKTR